MEKVVSYRQGERLDLSQVCAGALDFRYVKHFGVFPPFCDDVSFAEEAQSVAFLNTEFTCDSFGWMAPRFVLDGDSAKYAVVNGALYDKAVTKLIRYPAWSQALEEEKEKFVPELPETVEAIGSKALYYVSFGS